MSSGPPTRRAFAALLAATVALAGCAGATPERLVDTAAIAAPAEAIAGSHGIFIATTRAKADDPAYGFTGKRSDTVSFARVDVTVPKAHRPGVLERAKGQNRDPSRVFAATSLTGFGTHDAFRAALKADIDRHGGRALVFVHGYNTGFDAAVYRATQIVHDSGYSGTPILFTWASAGRAVDYVYDNNSASAARDALEGTLRLAVAAGAKRIDIVAHSMGNWVAVEALRQMAIAGDRDLNGRLGDVVLASPDIDVDVFKSQMRRYGKPNRSFFVLLSDNDRALGFSRLIAGDRPRLGDADDVASIAELGVIVVDVTKVEAGDDLNHAKFADNPLLVKLLGDRLREGDSLGTTERQLTDHVGSLARTLGETAAIVITTPLTVINVAVGG